MTAAHDLMQLSPDVWSNGHLRFDPADVRSGKKSWDIRLHDVDYGSSPVGHIRWNSLWQEYVLLTRADYIFAHDCLTDIATLLRHLNDA